jgi:hypothetical protein
MSCAKFWNQISNLYKDLTVQIALILVSVLSCVKIFFFLNLKMYPFISVIIIFFHFYLKESNIFPAGFSFFAGQVTYFANCVVPSQ